MTSVQENIRDSKNIIQLIINEQSYIVKEDIPPDTSLNIFIRDYAKLRGTKAMCLEGGCGACIVSVKVKNEDISVNSCLVPILICNGWVIKTIEGLGNKKNGYHTLQTGLAGKNGSQCGFCSPGMVMNMYSLLKKKNLTMKQIENSFGSNICRCTGYRPILDTFKAFANDAEENLVKDIQDIEELFNIKTCKKISALYENSCNCCCTVIQKTEHKIDMKLDNSEFHKILSIDDLFALFQKNSNASYILHGGNTAHGVYRSEIPDIIIDINDISDLRNIRKDNDTLTIGGNVTLTVAIETFEKYSKEPGFKYLQHLAKHIDLIASVPVRNIGSLAGNLMIKYEHREFPSDLFLILETAGAQLHIVEAGGKKTAMTLLEFLNCNMKHKIIYSIILPALGEEYEYRSYKIMPRSQNAHAAVNAAFLFKLDGSGKVLEKPNIIIGGINKNFLHASKTENFLFGKFIFEKNIVKQALDILDAEIQPDYVLPDYSPKFRKILAEGLFYKFILSIKPENVNPILRSGGSILERGLSSGKQNYDTNKNLWPLNQPLPKMEAIYQTSGEAHYTNDFPPFPNEVFCAFVLTTVANGKIKNIDASEALKMKGVIAFYTAKDIPGKNVFIPANSQLLFLNFDEVLFVDTNIEYAGQPIGVIVATTFTIANQAAQIVNVSYIDFIPEKILLTIEDVLALNDNTRIYESTNSIAQTKGNDVKHIIKGTFRNGSQYHFTMETQTCVCVPIEDGIDVFAATQWMDLTQVAIAQCLNIKNNSCYDYSTWTYQGFEVKTDLPSNTFCRAPGSTEGIAIIENIMEHIAKTVEKDPLEVRYANMIEDHKKILQPMIEELCQNADYDIRKRAVDIFNAENRWKKKGISLIPMMFPLTIFGQFHALVSIYARDGTVSVTHGGIESGQGINTKVAQVAAHTLGIDLSLITVKASNNLTSPNNFVTGGSVTSETCAYATMMACKELIQRLEPIKKELKNFSWQKLVLTAHLKDVDLCARYMFTVKDDIKSYPIYGATIAEVEIDVLTGQHIIHRVDLIEDVGRSMNPELDLGQVEGAFTMGLGYWMYEQLIYDPKTGQLTNYRTWNYKPPGAKDIPVDFRVYFRRNTTNPLSILRSKATGEPPLCMSYAIPIAIHNALNSARKNSGSNDAWYNREYPLTIEKILLDSLTTKEQLVL
ncbi:uncharacterized protein LOC107992596 isoform X2 [Apis cerana]|uniref:uncharacterized protein LOC107992596 isoform X2 n=1 Tax=Apis cerana TaxID=7461 RepID=UPI002B22F9C1|nr:uncharacterized protein LOC107992596 isoform X2 [Apis cerana]